MAINMDENSRLKKIIDSALDTGASELETIAIEATHATIQFVKDWIVNRWRKVTTSPTDKSHTEELRALETKIQEHNKPIEIGMEKKEIAVMWAMRKLGYTEEQTQQVLDLANQAYKPK